MGILGNMFGMDDEGSSDFGARLALASQALMAMDQGQQANIGPSIAALNAQRRKYMDQAKSQKWLQAQAAGMADKNPRLAAILENAPPGVGESLISKYLETQFQPPDWKTFESQGDVYRYDQGDPNSKPSMFFDGPDDPFKALLRSIDPSAGQPPAPSPVPGAQAESGAPPPSSSEAPDMPSTGGALTPQMKMLARSFGLPENATVDDVMALRDAALTGGEDNARAVAEAIRQKYKDATTADATLTQNQNQFAQSLATSYQQRSASNQTIINIANSIKDIPPDGNGFERMAIMFGNMKVMDPLGSVKDGDVAQAGNATSVMAQIEQVIKKYSGYSAGDIPADAALEMKNLILKMGEITSKSDYMYKKQTLKRAIAAGIPSDKAEALVFGSLQPDESDMEGYQPRFTPTAPPPAAPGGSTPGPTMNWTPGGGVQQ